MFRALSSITRFAEWNDYVLRVHFGMHSFRGMMPDGTQVVWYKGLAVEHALNESDIRESHGLQRSEWIWQLDLDVLITNSSAKLEPILPGFAEFGRDNGKEVILAKGCRDINYGSVFFRNTEWSRRIQREMRAYYLHHRDMDEQAVFALFHRQNALGTADRTMFLPAHEINAYPEEINCYSTEKGLESRPWRRGDRVLHFAGACAYEMKDAPNSTNRWGNFEHLYGKYGREFGPCDGIPRASGMYCKDEELYKGQNCTGVSI